MERNITLLTEKMKALALSYRTHCSAVSADCRSRAEAERAAYDAAIASVYESPRAQLLQDLNEMRRAVTEFAQAQAEYPDEELTLIDRVKVASARTPSGQGCIADFEACVRDFAAAANALGTCPTYEDDHHLHVMAECLMTAELLVKNLDERIDADYPVAQLKERLTAQLNAETDQLNAEEAARCSAEQFPGYADCCEVSRALEHSAAQLRSAMLSCDRLSDPDVPEQILLARRPYAIDEATRAFWHDTMHLSDETLSGTGYFIPVSKSCSSVVINTTGALAESSEFESLLVSLFLQFVASFPTKSLQVCGLQGDLSGIVCSLVSELTSAVGENITFRGPKANEAAIAAGVDEISNLMEERVRFYGRKYADIFDYNARATESPHPFVLVLIHNYPYAFEERAVRKKVENIIESGGRCGIFTLLINRTDADLERFGEPVPPLDTTRFGDVIATYTGGQNLTIGGESYLCSITAPGFSESDFWTQLADSIRYVSRPVMLDSILTLPYERRPYFDELKIPVGKRGNDLQFFCLDVESTGKAAALVAGGTGSGKTTFLHTLILSGAANYSPEELEYYLIDFKDGVEFSNYLKKDGEPSAYIPHVSFVSLKNRVEDAYDVLHKIAALKTERNRLFSQAGATDFKTYHLSQKVRDGILPKLKRTIVIIDEYQNMLEPAGTGSAVLASKCAGRLLSLLKEVRNAGISIILSSQAICVGREAKDQIFNRVVFSGSENTINSAFETVRSADMMNELQRERGLAYLSEDGGVHTTLFKSAWAGKTNGTEHRGTAEQICRKWADVPANHMIISGNEQALSIADGCSALSACTHPIIENGVYEAVFGQSFLSDEPVSLEFTSAEFSSYVIIGDLAKARCAEAGAALSFLLAIRQEGYALRDAVSYCDINYTSEGRKHRSPLEDFAPALGGAIRFLKTEQDAADAITSLHTLYHERLDALKQGQEIDLTPRLLIVQAAHSVLGFELSGETAPADTGGLSAFDLLLKDAESGAGGKSADDIVRQLTLLYERGFEQHIFVILTEKEPQRLRELMPREIRYEHGVYCSKSALAAAEWRSSGEHISVDELADNCCIVLPNVSKVRPYQFDDCGAWFANYCTLLSSQE